MKTSEILETKDELEDLIVRSGADYKTMTRGDQLYYFVFAGIEVLRLAEVGNDIEWAIGRKHAVKGYNWGLYGTNQLSNLGNVLQYSVFKDLFRLE